MKAQIKIKRINKGILLPEVIENGDWIDLKAGKTVTVGEEPIVYIPLGIAVKLPAGYEAIVAPRSSTPKKFGIWCNNSFGIIDNAYCGNNDEWMFSATTIGCDRATIIAGERIAQFRIQLSQKATLWQRIKWLFTSGVEIVEVDELKDKDRGGFGTTGKK